MHSLGVIDSRDKYDKCSALKADNANNYNTVKSVVTEIGPRWKGTNHRAELY
jgi:hypothetical protein